MESIGDQILLFFAAFASVTGAIIAGFNLYDRFKAAKKPHDDHIQQVKEHEEKLERDYKMICKLQEQNHLLIENDLAVIEHIINDNHISRLIDRREEIQRYLIERS